MDYNKQLTKCDYSLINCTNADIPAVNNAKAANIPIFFLSIRFISSYIYY